MTLSCPTLFRPLLPLVTAALAAGAFSSQAALIAYDEAPQPDLSNSPLEPTWIKIYPGDNQVSGTTGRSAANNVVDRDFFRFTLSNNSRLVGIELLDGTDALGGGKVGFMGFVNGGTFGATVPTSPAVLEGYVHYNPTVAGTDILDDMATAAGAQGFTAPLGKGTYSFWIQETAVGTANYAFNFKVVTVPDQGPGLWLGFGALGLTLAAGRRLRAGQGSAS